jgi:hypothetical protein
MSINTNPERFYYVSNNRLALVEKNGTTTVDNASTAFKTISEAKPLRIHAISKADHFTTGTSTDSDEYSSQTLGPLGAIPTQFHEANINIRLASYFDMEYEKIVKQAKKYARSNFTQTGFISPVDF